MKKIIDIHSHPLYNISSGANSARKREFPVSPWSEEGLLQFMADSGISCTLFTSTVSYGEQNSIAFAKEDARAKNEASYALKKKYPNAIEYAAITPFADAQAAIDEIAYACDNLGACAVKTESNIRGLYLGNEVFDPIFDELERRKAVLILHPTTPPAYPENCATGNVMPLFEFVVDTTRTVLDMIMSGTLQRHPNVKVVVPHCGSFLPALHDRVTGLTGILADNGWQDRVDMSEAMKNLWFDTACDAMPTCLKQLLTVAPPDHILFGSDFPPIPGQNVRDKIRDMEQAEYLQPYLNGIMRENAQKLLGIGLDV